MEELTEKANNLHHLAGDPAVAEALDRLAGLYVTSLSEVHDYILQPKIHGNLSGTFMVEHIKNMEIRYPNQNNRLSLKANWFYVFGLVIGYHLTLLELYRYD